MDPPSIDIEKQTPLISKKQTFNCGICYEDYDTSQPDFSVKMLEGCSHMFCSECFTAYYQDMIEKQNAHDKLKCPEASCQVKPSIEEVKNIISGDSFAKFIKFQNNTLVAQNSHLIYCSTPDCETILDKTGAKKKKISCGKCKKNTCSDCH